MPNVKPNVKPANMLWSFAVNDCDTGYFANNDADISWYPKISSVFPILKPEDVAEAVVDAIKNNHREVILPQMLKAFIGTFRKTPRLSVHLLSMFGLWGPSKSGAV